LQKREIGYFINNNLDVLRLIVNHDLSNINLQNKEKITTLMCATTYNNMETIKILLDFYKNKNNIYNIKK
jgi:ankyrin repeat protein